MMMTQKKLVVNGFSIVDILVPLLDFCCFVFLELILTLNRGEYIAEDKLKVMDYIKQARVPDCYRLV